MSDLEPIYYAIGRLESLIFKGEVSGSELNFLKHLVETHSFFQNSDDEYDSAEEYNNEFNDSTNSYTDWDEYRNGPNYSEGLDDDQNYANFEML